MSQRHLKPDGLALCLKPKCFDERHDALGFESMNFRQHHFRLLHHSRQYFSTTTTNRIVIHLIRAAFIVSETQANVFVFCFFLVFDLIAYGISEDFTDHFFFACFGQCKNFGFARETRGKYPHRINPKQSKKEIAWSEYARNEDGSYLHRCFFFLAASM